MTRPVGPFDGRYSACPIGGRIAGSEQISRTIDWRPLCPNILFMQAPLSPSLPASRGLGRRARARKTDENLDFFFFFSFLTLVKVSLKARL